MILLRGLHCLSHGLEPVFWEEAVSKPEEEEAGELTQRPSLSLPEPHAFQQYLFPPSHLTLGPQDALLSPAPSCQAGPCSLPLHQLRPPSGSKANLGGPECHPQTSCPLPERRGPESLTQGLLWCVCGVSLLVGVKAASLGLNLELETPEDFRSLWHCKCPEGEVCICLIFRRCPSPQNSTWPSAGTQVPE